MVINKLLFLVASATLVLAFLYPIFDGFEAFNILVSCFLIGLALILLALDCVLGLLVQINDQFSTLAGDEDAEMNGESLVGNQRVTEASIRRMVSRAEEIRIGRE